MQYIQTGLLTKQNFIWCRAHGCSGCGDRSNFDWQRQSCDISTCELSRDGNLEKYGRPMKTAIVFHTILGKKKISKVLI